MIQRGKKASREACFDASRNIDIHTKSMRHSREEAIAGKTSGLISIGEMVTWRAKHFGIWWKMTVQITKMEYPGFFIDEMVSGPFRYMKHVHRFIQKENGALMTDEFTFSSPFGVLGKVVDKIIMKAYMKKLLVKRNEMIRDMIELP